MSWRENGLKPCLKQIKTLIRATKHAVMYAGGHDVSELAAPLGFLREGREGTEKDRI